MRSISKRLTAAFVAIAMIVTVLPAFASSASADEGGSGFFWDMDFSKNFGGAGHDHFYAVVATPDGGFIAVGYAEQEAFFSPNQTAGPNDTGDWVAKGGEDAIVVKFNSDGKIDWQKNFGGSGNDRFYGVALCANGSGFAAVGYSDNGSFGNGDWSDEVINEETVSYNGYGGIDAIIVKFDNNGNVEGKSNLGGTFDNNISIGRGDDHFYGVVGTSDGGFAVVGDTTVTGQNESYYNAVIVKYGENNPVPEVIEQFGSEGGNDHFYALAEIDDHHYVAVGQTGSLQDVTNPGLNALIVLYTITFNEAAGAVGVGVIDVSANSKVFGGPGEDCFYGVAVSADGGFAAVGYSTEGSFDNGGQNGQTGPNVPSGYIGDWEGNPGLGGQDAIIVKYGNEFTIEGKANFGGGGEDCFYGVVATNDGGFVAVGYRTSNINDGTDNEPVAGPIDAMIVKFDSSGKVWNHDLSGDGDDCFYGVVALPNNGGFVAVGYSDEDSFGAGNWENHEGLGNDDATIVKFAKVSTGGGGGGSKFTWIVAIISVIALVSVAGITWYRLKILR